MIELALVVGQAAAPTSPDGIVYGLVGVVGAFELTTLPLTWVAFNAEARLEKDLDQDIDDAVSGYEAGLVVPAVAALIEAVLDVKQDDEPVSEALLRAETSRELNDVVEASSTARSPRDIEQRAVRGWTVAAISLLVVQFAVPAVLLNPMLNSDVLSATVRVVAGVAGIAALAVFVAAMVVVRNLRRSLSRAIRKGKEAPSGT